MCVCVRERERERKEGEGREDREGKEGGKKGGMDGRREEGRREKIYSKKIQLRREYDPTNLVMSWLEGF